MKDQVRKYIEERYQVYQMVGLTGVIMNVAPGDAEGVQKAFVQLAYEGFLRMMFVPRCRCCNTQIGAKSFSVNDILAAAENEEIDPVCYECGNESWESLEQLETDLGIQFFRYQ